MDANEYDIMYRVEDRHWWYGGLRKMIDAAWRRFVRVDEPKLLDLGCGTGANLEMMAPSAHPTGIDFSPFAIEKCRLRGMRSLVQASALDLPFAAGQFDAVFVMDVLYHQSISDKSVPLKEAYRALKPGGLLFINVPAYQWLYSSHDRATQTGKRFTRGEVVGLLRGAGLEPLRATYWNTLLFPPIALVRLWRKRAPVGTSDLDNYKDSAMSRVFGAILALERLAIRCVSMPFGLSVFVVARKP